MQYSCAYFDPWTLSLENAQKNKISHILSKLLIEDTSSVLDIGSGWGALAAQCTELTSNSVVGITISEKQIQYSQDRWQAPNLKFLLQDYRDHIGSYDRIVSVGMLEHVGPSNYAAYFSQIQRLLKPNGLALVHTIGRRGPPSPINPWIRRHIFPATYLPSLSQLTSAIEQQKLWILDCENVRLHYAKTLSEWAAKFSTKRQQFEKQFGPNFVRAWEYYLTACELGFRYQGLTVYQLQLARDPAAAPLTRRYMVEREQTVLRSIN